MKTQAFATHRQRSRIRAWFGSASLILLSATILGGQTLPTDLDLRSSLLLALDYNPEILAAQERIRREQAILIEVRAPEYPRLELGGDYGVMTRSRQQDFGGFARANNQFWSTDLTLSYLVYAGGAVTASVEAQREREQAAFHTFQAVVNDVLLVVSQRYFSAIAASSNIQVQEEAIALLTEQLQLARNRFDAGAGSQFEVLQAEVALANARPPLVRAKFRYRLDVDALRRVIGLTFAPGDNEESIRLKTEWPDPEIRVDLNQALELALSRRPELEALDNRLRADQEMLRAARAGLRPRLEIFTGYGVENRQFDSSLTDVVEGWQAGARVSWPIFDGFETRGRVRVARSEIRQTEIDQDRTRLSIEGQVREAWLDLEEAREILASVSATIEQAKSAVQLAENRFRVGAATQLDLLQSQVELTRAQQEEVAARFLYNSAAAAMKRAIGAIGIPGEGNDAVGQTQEPAEEDLGQTH